MCQPRSLHHYCLHTNLTNWSATYAAAICVNWISLQPELIDDYIFTWMAGASWGLLAMWALEMGREWLKRNLAK